MSHYQRLEALSFFQHWEQPRTCLKTHPPAPAAHPCQQARRLRPATHRPCRPPRSPGTEGPTAAVPTAVAAESSSGAPPPAGAPPLAGGGLSGCSRGPPPARPWRRPKCFELLQNAGIVGLELLLLLLPSLLLNGGCLLLPCWCWRSYKLFSHLRTIRQKHSSRSSGCMTTYRCRLRTAALSLGTSP